MNNNDKAWHEENKYTAIRRHLSVDIKETHSQEYLQKKCGLSPKNFKEKDNSEKKNSKDDFDWYQPLEYTAIKHHLSPEMKMCKQAISYDMVGVSYSSNFWCGLPSSSGSCDSSSGSNWTDAISTTMGTTPY